MSGGEDIGEGRCLRETDAAILVELETGDEVWIPKSCLHDDSEVYAHGHEGKVVVASWWAERNNLV